MAVIVFIRNTNCYIGILIFMLGFSIFAAITVVWSIPNSEAKKLSNSQPIVFDSETLPRTILLDPNVLVKAKQGFMTHSDSIMQEFLKKIIIKADSFLGKKPTSVIEKNQLPPGGNKHDFFSLAAYEWPNPNTPDGLPYVSRDGEKNPEVYTISDKQNMDDMIDMVKTLALAYYFTNDPKYALKAEELLRVWFLENDTYMNPNLNYAEIMRGKEIIPGKKEINPSGIMEGKSLSELTDAIRLLQHSPQWSEDLQRGIESWFSYYLDWLLNSDSGKEEVLKMNNHGTYYLVQVTSIALFLNKTDFAREILKTTMQEPSSATVGDVSKLIAVKIKPDGRQPFELNRANSLDYSAFNLRGMFELATIGERLGVDLWNYEIHGSGMRKALDYILPYFLKNQTWPYQQIKPIGKDVVAELLCQAIIHYHNNESYIQAYKSINTEKLTNSIYSPICNQAIK